MISYFEPEREFSTPEHCHIVEIHNVPEDASCSIARARVEPGVSTQLHALRGTTERYVILSGAGRAEVAGEEPIELKALDVVTIPAGESQRITNHGTEDLVFLCICTPRFRPECYVNLEA